MNTVENPQAIATFITKLWDMVNSAKNTTMIRWHSMGRSFLITNQQKFADIVLPVYFKHTNFDSFVRQLNMYDFHKVSRVSTNGIIEYSHENFQKSKPLLLLNIKRKCLKSVKKPTTTTATDTNLIITLNENEAIQSITIDGDNTDKYLMRNICQLQQKFDSNVKSIATENSVQNYVARHLKQLRKSIDGEWFLLRLLTRYLQRNFQKTRNGICTNLKRTAESSEINNSKRLKMDNDELSSSDYLLNGNAVNSNKQKSIISTPLLGKPSQFATKMNHFKWQQVLNDYQTVLDTNEVSPCSVDVDDDGAEKIVEPVHPFNQLLSDISESI